MGGELGRRLRSFTERYPFAANGLSLSLGGPGPLDADLLLAVQHFLDTHGIRAYTEHLSYCTDEGHLYDLMPIPFTGEAVRHVAARIRHVQEVLERPIAIEHVSYYAAPGAEMSEIEFVTAVLAEADCGLLLDVNNIFVNAVNHGYEPLAFLRALPAGRVWYLHTAGHYVEAPDLRVDTHGAAVCEDVVVAAGRGLCALRRGADAARAGLPLPAAGRAARTQDLPAKVIGMTSLV